MKLALIPPLQLLAEIQDRDTFMALPHLIKHEGYAEWLAKACNDEDKFVMLDNGAAEAIRYTPIALAEIGKYFGVDELVATDVLRDSAMTVVNTERCVLEFLESGFKGRIAVVAQGGSPMDALWCVEEIMARVGMYVDTICIPRLLITKQDNIRIQLAARLHELYADKAIHLLGASRLHPHEVQDAARMPFIRSIDTSLPFVTGLAYEQLSTRIVASPHREASTEYFGVDVQPTQRILAAMNCQTYEGWISGVSSPC